MLKDKRKEIGQDFSCLHEIGVVDSGFFYLRLLGISQTKSQKEMDRLIEAKVGRDVLARYYNDMPDDGELDPGFYHCKNRHAVIAELFTGCQDAECIRKCSNWIDAHRDAFGKEILEIGCDIGFMTGFLALTFPDSHITAIDRVGDGIEIAKRRMEDLGVSNVEFVLGDVTDTNLGKQFDTVISMRCLQENMEGFEDGISYEMLRYDFNTRFIPAASEYAQAVADLVKEGGTLVTLQNNFVSPMMELWLYMQGYLGFRIEESSYKELTYHRMTDTEKIQAYYSRNVGTDCHLQNTGFWYGLFGITSEKARFTGWAAEVVRDLYATRLLKGVAFLDPDGYLAGKFALYTCESDIMPKALVLYSSFDMDAQTQLISPDDISFATEVVQNIIDMKDMAVRSLIEDLKYSMYMLKPVGGLRVDEVDMEKKLH